jgi:hypothetical protein
MEGVFYLLEALEVIRCMLLHMPGSAERVCVLEVML